MKRGLFKIKEIMKRVFLKKYNEEVNILTIKYIFVYILYEIILFEKKIIFVRNWRKVKRDRLFAFIVYPRSRCDIFLLF